MKDYSLGSVSFPANEVVTKSARFLQDYERYRDEVANGSIGKTGQFCMIHLNLVKMQSFGQTTSGTSKRHRITDMCIGVYSILLCHEQD